MTGSLGKISIHKGFSRSTRETEFEAFYNAYFDRLYAYAKVICNSQYMAKDVVSEFFFNLWKNKTDFSKIQNLDSYFFISVKNQAIRMLSARTNEHDSVEEVRAQSVELVNPEEVLLEKELRIKLDDIIDKLPEQCRLVFQMSREKGLKYSEIAAEIGISVETVKTQMNRAQNKLRQELIAYYQDKNGGTLQDTRLIGQYLLIASLYYYNLFN